MIIKSINLNNIRSYLNVTVEFPLGSTLLSGDIGSGKSTILQSIEFALFGTRGAAAQLLRHGQDSGFVELNFSLDDKDITIKRLLKRGRSISQESCLISVNGFLKDCMPTELKAQIISMFGYPKEALSKDSPIFRYTVYTPQEEMKHIMFDPEARLVTLRKLFNVEKYGQIRANTRLLLSEFRSMKRFLEEYTKDAEKWTLEKAAKEKEAVVTRSSVSSVNSQLDKINAALAGIDEQINETRSRIDALHKIKNELSRKEGALKLKTERKIRLQKDVARYSEGIEKLSAELVFYPALTAIADTFELKKQLGRLEGEKLQAASMAAVLGSEIHKMRRLLESGKCAVCGQVVHEVEKFRNEMLEKEAEEGALRSKTQETEAAIRETKARMDEANAAALKAEKRAYTERSLSDAQRSKGEAEKELQLLSAEISKDSEDAAALSIEMQNFESAEKSYRELESRRDAALKEKISAEREKAGLEQSLRDAEHLIASLKAEIEMRQAAKEKTILVDMLSNWLENQFIILMDVMERSVMARINQEFMSLFQRWFDVLMQDEMLSVRLDENFSPIIQQNGYETEYSNLSGGEKTAVALAYRLALNKVINELVETIKTKDLLILDEPTDGFSSEQLDRIRDVINELKLKQIIIVSHESKIDTFVDNVIRVHKDNHVSRVTG